MNIRTFFSLAVVAGVFFLPLPAAGNGGPAHQGKGHHDSAHPGEGHPAGGKDAMKAQHERMAQFGKAAQAILDAIIHNSMKLASEGADLLDRSLAGHENDVPHRNQARIKEFHGLFVELGKRTAKLKETISADDLPRTAVAYGRVLEVCASCHKTFRD